MPEKISREIWLKNRPVGLPTEDSFEIVEVPIPQLTEGQILIRTIWMSVDPYMRGRMVDQRSYVPPYQVGEVLDGGSVGQIIESKNTSFAVGDYVSSGTGAWREFHVSAGGGLTRIDPDLLPIQSYLGAMGMPGLTAWGGLLKLGEPKEGETVLVSGAAGAVGSIVCQIAKIAGCRVVGTAGSDKKCAWLTDGLGIDAAINYKTAKSLHKAVRDACPNGVDVYFDNVGGEHLTTALFLMNMFGRLVMCGMIDQYNATERTPGPHNLSLMIGKGLTMKGFTAGIFANDHAQFLADMKKWAGEGRMKWEETVFEGIENAPKAFIGLFTGENMGKMLVKLGPDPAI